MKAAQHRYRDDLSSLSASTRRACTRCAGRPLSQRSMRAPVVEIADILGQDPLQIALIKRSLNMKTWSTHSVLTDLIQRSAIAFARGDPNGVRAWAIPRLHTRRSNVAP